MDCVLAGEPLAQSRRLRRDRCHDQRHLSQYSSGRQLGAKRRHSIRNHGDRHHAYTRNRETPEPEISLGKGERASNPQTLPGGEWIFFQLYTGTASAEQGEVVVQSRTTGERRLLIKGAQDARYVRSGHIVYGNGNTLLVQPFNPDRRTLSGGPVPVLDGVANVGGTDLNAPSLQFAVSSTGTMLYVPVSVAGAAPLTRLVVVTRDGRELPPSSRMRA